jgi:uncharacterized repeat protein (TIGR03847 family)
VNYVFNAPDRIMVGTRGEVGSRLFLFQVREGRRLVIVKCEKQQLASLSTWLAVALENMGRPGHLPEEMELEAEYEVDLIAGEISIGLDQEKNVIELLIASDDESSTLEVTLTREWAAALSIAVTRLVEAGRPPCPLCALPLDPRGHDCPRTNGHTAPLR